MSQKIIYTRPDGGTAIVVPAKNARLAFSVTLADGTKYASEEQVIAEGENAATGEETKIVKAIPVNRIFRRWPVVGAVVEWAESEDEFVERIRQKDVPADATNVRVVDEFEIPSDRTFRNAWKADLTVDMPKAREIKRGQLRALRKPLMEALDVAYMRADEAGDTAEKQRIATLKQALRDVTADPAIEAAQTPDELKAVMPQALRAEIEQERQ